MWPVYANGLIQRLKGTRNADSASALKPIRMGSYQEALVQPMLTDLMGADEEGSFYIATNPTYDSPIATTTTITTYAETAGAVGVVLVVRNTATLAENSPRLKMAYIKLMIVQVPTSATSWKYALLLDDSPVRITSGGTAITPVCTNGDSNASSVAAVTFGAITTAVPTNRRQVGRGNLRGVIPTTFDQMVIQFGWGGQAAVASAAASGSVQCLNAPCTIRPQQNLALTLWGASNAAAPTYEFEVGWIEK